MISAASDAKTQEDCGDMPHEEVRVSKIQLVVLARALINRIRACELVVNLGVIRAAVGDAWPRHHGAVSCEG